MRLPCSERRSAISPCGVLSCTVAVLSLKAAGVGALLCDKRGAAAYAVELFGPKTPPHA